MWPVRAVPRRNGAPGGDPRAHAALRERGRPRGRDAPERHRAGDAGRVDLRARTDRGERHRVRHSRRLVLELLASSVDMSLCSTQVQGWMARYGATPARFGDGVATVAQPVKIDNELYVRDYSRCILCYKCVEACGVDAQNTFAIGVGGRGFDAHISTEFDVGLPDSARV